MILENENTFDSQGWSELDCENGCMKYGLHNQWNIPYNSNDILHRIIKSISKFMWKQRNPDSECSQMQEEQYRRSQTWSPIMP